MSSGIFLLSVLLLVLNAASVALGVLPLIHGPITLPQLLGQILPAAIALVLCLLLPFVICARRHKPNGGYILAAGGYFFVMIFDVGPAVYLTNRWQKNELDNDYKNVPRKEMLVLMVVIVYWAAALLAIICVVSALAKAHRKGKTAQANAYSGNQQRTPPRELQSAPAARPFVTTYGKTPNTYSNTYSRY